MTSARRGHQVNRGEWAPINGPKQLVLGSVALLLLLEGCSGGRSPTGDSPPDSSISSPTSTIATTPTTSLTGALKRCPAPSEAVISSEIRQFELRGPGRNRLTAATVGTGRTVAVLLHQTDGSGMCGWLDFASAIASRRGQSALLFDFCDYVESRCPDSGYSFHQERQVAIAVRYARQRLHATRVVLVGASMGGSVAVISAGRDVPVDSFVDLSGPTSWNGVDLTEVVDGIEVPGLFAMAASTDGAEAATTTRELAAAGPQGSRFLGADAGHGYELLLDDEGALRPVGEAVLRWIRAGPR